MMREAGRQTFLCLLVQENEVVYGVVCVVW